MIRIEMTGLLGARATLGPSPCFELDGGTLCEGPKRRVVALREQHAWQARQHFFSSFEIRGAVLVTFLDRLDAATRRRVEGRFEHLRVAGGYVYGDGALIAEFSDDESQWRSRREPTGWAVVRIDCA